MKTILKYSKLKKHTQIHRPKYKQVKLHHLTKKSLGSILSFQYVEANDSLLGSSSKEM